MSLVDEAAYRARLAPTDDREDGEDDRRKSLDLCPSNKTPFHLCRAEETFMSHSISAHETWIFSVLEKFV